MYDQRSEHLPISIDGIPCPFHYAAFFTSLITHPNHYWEPVEDLQTLQSGDFMVYLPPGYQPKEVSKIQTKKTGTHVMLIERILRLDPNHIELVIIDCTRAAHCSEDHRTEGGIGRSPLNIHIQRGQTSIQWGDSPEQLTKDLFFGRLR
jgi:hypothetical protein